MAPQIGSAQENKITRNVQRGEQEGERRKEPFNVRQDIHGPFSPSSLIVYTSMAHKAKSLTHISTLFSPPMG